MAAKKIGGSIVLEGASKYNSDLKNIKSNLSQLRSEMKVCTTQYASSANSAEALYKKHEILGKEIEQVSKRVETYAKMQEDAKKQQTDAAAAIDKYTIEVQEAKDKLKEMETSGKATNEELEEQKKVLTGLEGELSKANSRYEDGEKKIKQYATAENNAQAELNTLNNELQENDKYLDEAKESADGCAKSIDEYGNEVKEAGDQISVFGDVVKGSLAADAIEAGLKVLVNGIKEAAEYAIEVGSSFEAGMSKVAAISGATGAELDALTAKAKEMGATTMFSATESADALSYMAMAGWKTDQMIEGLPAVMNLAAASGEDLATVSDILTDDLTAFGLSAEDAAHFADVLAAASSNANTNVSLMGETFKYAGPIAGAMGYSIEDLAVATGLMANSGIKASNAGTALRSMITRLAKPTKESAQAMEDLHINLTDSEGNMLSFMEIMEQLRGSFAGLTEAEKAQEAAMLAGKTGMSGLLAIVNASEADFEKLCMSIDNANGSAERMAATMQDNLKGKITILHSALEGLGISIYDVFSDDLKRGVEGATDAIGRLQDSVENGSIGVSLNKMSEALGDFIEGAVEAGEKVLPVLIDALTWIIDNAPMVFGALAGMKIGTIVGEAITAYQALTTALEGASVAQAILNGVMAANPIGLVCAAVGILAGALIGLEAVTRDQTSAYDEQYDETFKLIESTKKLTDSAKESIDARKKNRESLELDKQVTNGLIKELETLQGQTKLTATEQARQQMIVDELNQKYPELGLAIDKTSGALNMSTDAIRDNIDAMLENQKAAAALEDMADIAKEQYESEKRLADLEKERSKLLQENAEASKQAAEEIENYGRITDETQERCTYASEAIEGLNEDINAEKEVMADLAEEYQYAAQYVTEANDQMVDSAQESSAAIQQALYELSEEQQKELEKITATVADFDGLFSKMETEAKTSLEQMNENLKTNAKGMDEYADNVHKAMDIAARSTDESTKDIIDYLISLGVDGAAELALFVSAAEENSAAYNEILKNFGDYEQAKYEAEMALQDWNLGLNDGYDTIITTANTKHDELTESQQKMFDTQMEQAEQYKTDAVEMATETQQSVAQATLDEQPTVEEAHQTVAQAAIDKTTETLKIADGKSEVFYDIGMTIDESLASGISDGTSGVCTAVKNMCEEVVASVDISGLTSRIDAALAAGAERAAAIYGGG